MHDGKFGELPDDYLLFRAARYMGVAVWELEERDPWYLNHALAYQSAEIEAQNKREEKEARRRKNAPKGRR